MDTARLIRLIEREQIELLCFQEGSPDPILEAYLRRGWYWRINVASRYPILSFARMPDAADLPEPAWRTQLYRIRIRAKSGIEFDLATVHLDTVRHGLESLVAGDPGGMTRHAAWREREATRVATALADSPDIPILVGGDLNLPPDSPMLAPFRSRFRFGFEEAGWGYGYTRPAVLPWVRIDHILASPHWRFIRCRVGPDVGSDHLPLIAEVALSDPPQRSRQ